MSQTLEYKGYSGSVLFSAEDKILYGKLVGIRDTITYEGKDVKQLEASFKAAVNEYLQFCEVEGKAPDKPFKGSFNIRIGHELHKRAALYAQDHNQKLNTVIHDALEEFLAHS